MADDPVYRRPAREWPIPPMDKEPGYKDTAFTWEMGRLILQRIADGDTMKAITADPRMPAYCTVFRWMNVVPEFGRAVAEVRAMLAAERLRTRQARALARGPKRRSGRRSTFTEAAARAVLEAVREGASVSELVRAPGMPSFRALYAWLRDRPEFQAAFEEACGTRARRLDLEADFAAERVRLFGPGRPEADAERRALFARKGRLTPKLYRAALSERGLFQPYHRDLAVRESREDEAW